jgi:hypothetical protein
MDNVSIAPDINEKGLLSAFERLLGRQASDQEKIRLLRTKDVLGLRENDALWLILMSLEEYGYRFDQISKKVQKETTALVEAHRQILDAEAISAAEKAQGVIADALAKRVEKSIAQVTKTKFLTSLGWSVIALVLLAALCFVAGFVMGSGKAPWWTRPAEDLTNVQIVVSSIIMAPAGWIFSLLALPCTAYYLYYFSLVDLTRKEQAIKITEAGFSVLATLTFLYWTFAF